MPCKEINEVSFFFLQLAVIFLLLIQTTVCLLVFPPCSKRRHLVLGSVVLQSPMSLHIATSSKFKGLNIMLTQRVLGFN